MFGQANRAGTRYYRHVYGKQRGCDISLWCRAEELEEVVLVRLFATLGDAAGIEAAMMRAIPDRAKVEALCERKMFLENELLKVETSKDRLIQPVSDGLFSKEEVAMRIQEVRERENLFKSEIGGITSQLNLGPTEEEVRRKAKFLHRMIGEIYRNPARLAKMSFEEKR